VRPNKKSSVLNILFLVGACLWISCNSHQNPSIEKDGTVKLSNTIYKDLDFKSLDSVEVCRNTTFRELNNTLVIVAYNGGQDSSFNHFEATHEDSLYGTYLLKFDNDSMRWYGFCSDLDLINAETGEYYKFSSGLIHYTLCEVDSTTMRFISDVDSAYFKRGKDSVLVKDELLWYDLNKPKKETIREIWLTPLNSKSSE